MKSKISDRIFCHLWLFFPTPSSSSAQTAVNFIRRHFFLAGFVFHLLSLHWWKATWQRSLCHHSWQTLLLAEPKPTLSTRVCACDSGKSNFFLFFFVPRCAWPCFSSTLRPHTRARLKRSFSLRKAVHRDNTRWRAPTHVCINLTHKLIPLSPPTPAQPPKQDTAIDAAAVSPSQDLPDDWAAASQRLQSTSSPFPVSPLSSGNAGIWAPSENSFGF